MKTITNTKKLKLFFLKLSVFIILFTNCSTGFSQNDTEDKTISPYFFVMSDNPEVDKLPLKNTHAEVNIVGMIADVTINQVYKNDGKNTLEAVYTFPASTNAAIYSMEMIIGNRKITAKIKEREKARTEYEQAKSEGKRASLLEQQRPNVFQMNVANIMPGDEIEVTMKYTEMITPEKGTYRFVYPSVVGPRYSNQSGAGSSPRDKFVETPYQKEGEGPFYNFDIDVYVSAGIPIQNIVCPTHKINIVYPNATLAEVNLDKTETKAGNRDYVLEYQLSGNKIESGLMLYEHGDENFFMLMVQPPKKVLVENIPQREYIFIVDVSGSMMGFPMSVTKKLLRNLVVNLKTTDMFNIIVFSGSSGWMSDESVPATLENVDKAIQFIDRQKGGGGTEILPALQKALSFPRKSESLSRSFVIVTDGYISVEKEVFELIRNNNDKANTFAFGIGSSVNRFLIEGIANAGMGEPLIVLNEDQANKEAEKFREYINNPVLTQVKKEFSGFDVYDVEPVTIPDVLAERPVIIYGKYRGTAKGNITIKGHTGKGRFSKTFNVSDVKPDVKNAAIRYLWARKNIQQLDDYSNIHHEEQLKEMVTQLGLKYNLMTAYTSFLAIDEVIANDGKKVTTVNQPLPLPQGVSNYAVGFDLEIDNIELSFSLYKDVKVFAEFSDVTKKEIKNEIIKLADAQLQSCLGSVQSGEIEITVDASGKVVKIEFSGSMSGNKEKENCLKELISKWDFKKHYLNKEWSFKIEV